MIDFRYVATSRQALRIPAEWTFITLPVAPDLFNINWGDGDERPPEHENITIDLRERTSERIQRWASEDPIGYQLARTHANIQRRKANG